MVEPKPECPPDLLPLNGNTLPLHAQIPKSQGKTAGVKQAIIGGCKCTHCPACAKWVPGEPKTDNPLDVPKITNRDGPSTVKCRECGYTLATIGVPLYQTGNTIIPPSSNSGRVAGRRGGIENV